MPTMYILGGPNGSGKTTFYTYAIEEKYIEPNLQFINIDLIVRNELGNYNEVNFAKAESIARGRIAGLIKKYESFMIESNLAKESEYEWIEKIMKKGYDSF